VTHMGRHPGCGWIYDNCTCWLLAYISLGGLAVHNSYVTLLLILWNVTRNRVTIHFHIPDCHIYVTSSWLWLWIWPVIFPATVHNVTCWCFWS